MTKKLVASLGAALVVVMAMMATSARAQDPGPIAGALATLAAATAQAEQVRSAQRATVAAVSAQATSQAVMAQATVRAIAIEATRQAQSIQATETAQAFAVRSTAQAQSAQATQGAMEVLIRQRAATATAQAQDAQGTRTAQVMSAQATATSQAVAIAAQATDTAQLSTTYATRQDRFTWGLLLVETLFVCGAAWVLWKLTRTLAAWAVKLCPQKEPTLADVIVSAAKPTASVVIDAIPVSAPAEPRMPDVVQVVDSPEMVDAMERWAEQFDAERGLNDGDD